MPTLALLLAVPLALACWPLPRILWRAWRIRRHGWRRSGR